MFYLKNTVGTVNFTDWLHVTCSKVSDPSTILWEDWYDAPVSNLAFAIPVADADNYYVRYYDAPTNASLGTLHLELIVNALTNEILFERRWYLVDGPGDYDPADGDATLTDPYLINKTVHGIFKEGFRYFKETDEYTFNDVTGEIAVVNGTQWATGERIMVDIKYAAASTSTTASGGLYSGSIEVTDENRTLLVDELNYRIVCAGSTTSQKLLLPLLAAVGAETGYYIDNSVKGTAKQVVVHCDGSDKIKFTGFMASSDEFTDLWVSKGEHLLLRKRDGYWEVITDYKGVNVGEKVTLGYKGHPNVLTENGQLVDGDEYPRLWWWINNVLPATHYYTDANVEDPGFTPSANSIGMFVIHPTLKKFRMPKTNGLSEKGLADFETYGADVANRPVDYPGGYQKEMILDHHHILSRKTDVDAPTNTGDYMAHRKVYGNNSDYFLEDDNREPNIFKSGGAKEATSTKVGTQQRVNNIGVIYGRRI